MASLKRKRNSDYQLTYTRRMESSVIETESFWFSTFQWTRYFYHVLFWSPTDSNSRVLFRQFERSSMIQISLTSVSPPEVLKITYLPFFPPNLSRFLIRENLSTRRSRTDRLRELRVTKYIWRFRLFHRSRILWRPQITCSYRKITGIHSGSSEKLQIRSQTVSPASDRGFNQKRI